MVLAQSDGKGSEQKMKVKPENRRTIIQRFNTAVLVAWFAVVFCPRLVHSQELELPATGFWNTFLDQVNILECDNTSNAEIQLRLRLRGSNTEEITSLVFGISAFGAKHIILSDIASISDAYGSYRIEYVSGPSNLGEHLSCRTVFYRWSSNASIKLLDFAYVLPVKVATEGVTGGIYNSYNPSGLEQPTLNWLSVINQHGSSWSGQVEVYGIDGSLHSIKTLTNLLPGERRDLPLGHDRGQTTGTYRIIPEHGTAKYQAYLIRYGLSANNSFRFAFPLYSLSGTCQESAVQLSTMNNGLTQNWIELANLSSSSIQTLVTLRDRFGTPLKQQLEQVTGFKQKHIYVNSHLDPSAFGNVGSASIECDDDNAPLLMQSAYYGRTPGQIETEWSYAVQAGVISSTGEGEQVVVPVNTHLGMYNWFKAVNSGPASTNLEFTVLEQNGDALAQGSAVIALNGTQDIGVHAYTGANKIGSFVAYPSGTGVSVQADILRVLPRVDGQLGYIVHIPGAVQTRTTLPEPEEGQYFPSGAVWSQDVSQAPVDAQSQAVITWLSQAGGFGSGSMRIDFSIEVLKANSQTSKRTFIETGDFYSPDCDTTSVPVPEGGALEGETGYECLSDGDCHLIVHDTDSKKLYEMWRANIVGSAFYGGCLAVWDLTQIYPASGRGQDCTSADASGFPIAPLLFSADEVAAGQINHAIRFILPNARIRHRTYVHPATHATGAAYGPANAPPYGARFRLRADFPLHSLPNEASRVVARAMQRYGMLLSDGGTIALTAQSDRFTDAKWNELLQSRDLDIIQVSDFEMIEGGPRSIFTGDCVRN